MDHTGIFSATLGLSQLWQIDRICFVDSVRRLDLFVSCRRATGLICPVCGEEAHHRAVRKELWCHVDFLNYRAYLHADVPLVECGTGCGVSTITVPWSRPGSRFFLIGSTRATDQRPPITGPEG